MINFFSSLPNTINICLPNLPDATGVIIGYQTVPFTKTPTKDGYTYSESNIVDTVGPNTRIEGFYSNGDLQKFMEWFDNNCYSSLYLTPQKVHVVTHSKAMQSYLKTLRITPQDDIIKTNSWRFITTKENPYNVETTLRAGVSMDKDTAKILEHTELSLCGKNGSVNDGSVITRGFNSLSKFTRWGRNMFGSGKRRTNKQKKSINKNKNKNKSKKRRFTKNKTK